MTRLRTHLFAALLLVTLRLVAGEREDWRDKMRVITPRSYVVRRAAPALRIDGRLDDAAWAAAPWTSDFVDIEGTRKSRPRFRTRAKLLWDDEALYIGAELEEPHVWARERKHDAVIFQDPDFEVFIDPDGDTHAYSELEINALGTTWDLLLNKPYQDLGSAHNEWEIAGLRTAVHVNGTLNDPSDTDAGWSVEMALPWAAFRGLARHEGPPNPGEQWRLNFSRVEWRIETKNGGYEKVPGVPEDNWVWSPQGVVDMHRPEMWGVLQFTREPPERPVTITPMPARAARDAVFEVYYAERDFRERHGRWAADLRDLGVGAAPCGNPDGTTPPRMTFAPTAGGYECRATIRGEGQWIIRSDRKIEFRAEGE